MENSKQDVYAGLSFSEPEAGHIVSSIHTYGRGRNLVQGEGIRGHHYKSCLQSMMTVPVPVTKAVTLQNLLLVFVHACQTFPNN